MSDQVASTEQQSERAFRDILNDAAFVECSMNIVKKSKADLAAGVRPASKVDREFDQLARAIKTLSSTANDVLLINLNKVCGGRDAGMQVYNAFLSALYLDHTDLDMNTRRGAVGNVYALFLEHGLPIEQRSHGLLFTYLEHLVMEIGCDWSVDHLARDIATMHKDGWRISDH